MRRSIVLVGVLLLAASTAKAASENLDELAARKPRLASATWDKSVLENPTTLVWQPETLAYTDTTTGHEIWRISTTKELMNSLPDLSWAHWSADGKRLSFGSNRDTSAAVSGYETSTNASYMGTVMMMKADGSFLRPANNGPFEVYVHSSYLQWSPVEPDVYYGFGRNFGFEWLDSDQLYKVTVGDTSISKQMVLDYNTGTELTLARSMSSDGLKILARGGNADNYWPTSIIPGTNTATLDDPTGWSRYRQLDNYWGNTPADTNYTHHFSALVGPSTNNTIIVMPEGYNSVWRFALSGGTDPDGGPAHTSDHESPFSWGDIEPTLTGDKSGGVCNATYRSPWCCDDDPNTDCDTYLSHMVFDRWGRYATGMNSSEARAHRVWDMKAHKWASPHIAMPSWDWHLDWNAWSDYYATSPSSKIDSGGNTGNIRIVKYDGSETIDVAVPHIREMGSNEYNSLPRVTQSPDGTKAVFHSDFLYSKLNSWDVFYAVAYYPHPPEITSVTGSGTYTINFDWRTDQTTSRGYTQRGWPNEATDDPPPPRETKLFRLWRSSDGTTWNPIKTVDANIFSKYNFSTGVWSGDKHWEFIDTPGDGTFYYAVTAQEHSGLESRVKSNVFNTAGVQTTAYPPDPKAGTGVTGVYQASMIRYYNIYAADGAAPAISQTNRIASIPASSGTSYVDWLGDTAGSTQYKVTAVDTQGNESAALSVTSSARATPGHYDVSWSGSSVQQGRRYRVRTVDPQ